MRALGVLWEPCSVRRPGPMMRITRRKGSERRSVRRTLKMSGWRRRREAGALVISVRTAVTRRVMGVQRAFFTRPRPGEGQNCGGWLENTRDACWSRGWPRCRDILRTAQETTLETHGTAGRWWPTWARWCSTKEQEDKAWEWETRGKQSP